MSQYKDVRSPRKTGKLVYDDKIIIWLEWYINWNKKIEIGYNKITKKYLARWYFIEWLWAKPWWREYKKLRTARHKALHRLMVPNET